MRDGSDGSDGSDASKPRERIWVAAWLNKCRLSGRWPWKLEKMDPDWNH